MIDASGTQIFFTYKDATSGNYVVGVFGCIDGLDLGTDTRDTQTLQCLDGTSKKVAGSMTYGDVSGNLYADPTDPIFEILDEEAQQHTLRDIEFAVGWSESSDAPTCDQTTGEWVTPLPATRTWTPFTGKITSLGLNFAVGSAVMRAFVISRETPANTIPATTTP